MPDNKTAETSLDVLIALRLSRVAYLLSCANAVAFSIIGYFQFSSPDFSLISIALSVVYLGCFILLNAGLYDISRFLFLIFITFNYFIALVFVGQNVAIETFIACFLIAPFFMFSKNERKQQLYGLLLVIIGVIIASYFAYRSGPLLDLPPLKRQMAYLSNIGFSSVIMLLLLFTYARSSIANFLKLQEERARSEEMLFELVPTAIAKQLIAGEHVDAQSRGECTVLFADLVDFSALADRLSPVHLVELLDGIFSDIDELCAEYDIEKIKTIGDSYMAATGVLPDQNRPFEIVRVGLGIIDIVKKWAEQTGYPLSVRVGINTGQVISGVIGTKRPQFDVWGQTVNNAQLLEANSQSNRILVSESTHWRLKGQYAFEHSQDIKTKSGQTISAFWLNAKEEGPEGSF